MWDVNGTEFLLLIVIAVVVLGPERLRVLFIRLPLVHVEDYDPQTESITVLDRTSGRVARLDAATGIMDVTDPRTGWTRSYDAPEDDWVKRDADDEDR